MAERVREALESCLDELEDLHSRGIFTREELKMVVKRRTAMEYTIVKKKPALRDFLRYIDYEMVIHTSIAQ